MCLGKENARRGIGALETCPPLIKHFSFFLLSSWVTVAAFCSETRCLTAVMPKTLVLGYSYVALPPYGVPLKLSRVCVAWEQKERSLLLDPRFLSPLVPLLPFCTRIQPSPACACSHRCVQHSNPMFAGGSSEKLVFCGEARWRGSQAKRLAAAFECNTPQLANFSQILAMVGNWEFSLPFGFGYFQLPFTGMMVDIMKDACSMLTIKNDWPSCITMGLFVLNDSE